MLAIQDLHASYAGIAALRGVSLEVAAGELVALIGPNGAGKSTLLNCLSGYVRPGTGRMDFDGVSLLRQRPHRVARRGLLQVPEGRQILAGLSVLDNLMLGALALGGRKATHSLAEVMRLFPILEERREQRAGTLSGGEQQMLAIGRALMGAPRLLLLDEPSLGLSPLMTGKVFEALAELGRGGLTILLVEQNARRALELTDRAYVIEQGRIVQAGRSRDLAEDPQVIAHYLGQVEEERAHDKANGRSVS